MLFFVFAFATCAKVIEEPAEDKSVEEHSIDEPPVYETTEENHQEDEQPVVVPPTPEKNPVEEYIENHKYIFGSIAHDLFFQSRIYVKGDNPWGLERTDCGRYVRIPTYFDYKDNQITIKIIEWSSGKEITVYVELDDIIIGGDYLYYLQSHKELRYSNTLVMPRKLYNSFLEFYGLEGTK